MDNIDRLFGITDIGLVTTLLNLNLKNYEINKELLREAKKNNNHLLEEILLELKSINNKLEKL